LVRIHWWRLDGPADRSCLTEDELARADRFVTPVLTARFIAGRAGLRTRLGALTGLDPRDLRLQEGAHGKPEIEHGPRFNLSHSGLYAVLAIADAADVGVDVEALRPIERDLAARYFSAGERASLATWADPTEGFHAVWTAKEAVMKGLGLGFKLRLSAFEVETSANGPVTLRRLDRAHGRATDWALIRPAAPAGYMATLAVRAASVRVTVVEPF
jgi:4'-phosphopantetheinyl transferase